LPLAPFRETLDPDDKRKEILWIALGFVVILSAWLAVVLLFGYRPLISDMNYDEAVLTIGGAVLLVCGLLYLAVREREQRSTNRSLLDQLGTTIADLDERVRQLHGLCSTSAQLIGSFDTTHVSRLIVASLSQIMEGSASLSLIDARSGLPRWTIAHPPLQGESEDDCSAPEAWPVPTLSDDGRIVDLDAQIKAWNQLDHVVAAPIFVRRTLQGVLIVQRRPEDRPFGPDHLDALETFANMAAKALESSDLYRELRENYLATVRALVYSLDARDNYAAAHGHRVAELAVRMAEHLGLPEQAIHDLEVFAPLHDVGKIGVPDAILLKVAPLTTEEMEACKSHVLIGERIIRPLKPGPDAVAIVRSHHEAWDGSGYPDGLKGEEIPILARLVQVADCYDALISDRPYRSFLSEDEAVAHFRAEAGKTFDPAVVEALSAVLRQGATPRVYRSLTADMDPTLDHLVRQDDSCIAAARLCGT